MTIPSGRVAYTLTSVAVTWVANGGSSAKPLPKTFQPDHTQFTESHCRYRSEESAKIANKVCHPELVCADAKDVTTESALAIPLVPWNACVNMVHWQMRRVESPCPKAKRLIVPAPLGACSQGEDATFPSPKTKSACRVQHDQPLTGPPSSELPDHFSVQMFPSFPRTAMV